MIADESTPEGAALDGPKTADGLGLWPEAVVSPHFTERKRMNALTVILAAHPELVGVGIDEGTAVIASNGTLEVVGRGHVTIVGPRQGSAARATDTGTSGIASRPVVRTLAPGAVFEYGRDGARVDRGRE